jgi:hypothetical protein
MVNWFIRLFTEPPVLQSRGEIKKLVTMTGITAEQQAELYDLCLHMHDDNLQKARALANNYERRGAKFVYILEGGKLKRNPEVDS